MTDPTNLSAQDQSNALAGLSNQELTPAQPSSRLRNIFVGAQGLRAGWGLLLFVALMFALLRGVGVLAKLMHLFPAGPAIDKEIAPGFLFFAELPPLLAALFVTWIMSKIEKRPTSAYGLGGERRLPNFFAGLAWGASCLSLLAFVLWKAGLLVFDGRLLFGADVLRYGAIWFLGFLVVGLLEEYLSRGYLLFTLARGTAGIYGWLFKSRHSKALGFWTAGLLISILFGLGHGKNPGESPIGLLSACLASLVFCLSLWRTGSLWWAIGLHASWDWAQSFLYGVADSGLMVQHHLLATHPLGKPVMSGGTTGPEGSILILPFLVVISFIIIFTLPRTSHGDSPANKQAEAA